MKVDKILQKTYLNVDEAGTEAAAVTGIMMLRACAAIPQRPIQMKCNHPFWFLLVDANNQPIFVASYV